VRSQWRQHVERDDVVGLPLRQRLEILRRDHTYPLGDEVADRLHGVVVGVGHGVHVVSCTDGR
jgi:hypothetical protein